MPSDKKCIPLCCDTELSPMPLEALRWGFSPILCCPNLLDPDFSPLVFPGAAAQSRGLFLHPCVRSLENIVQFENPWPLRERRGKIFLAKKSTESDPRSAARM